MKLIALACTLLFILFCSASSLARSSYLFQGTFEDLGSDYVKKLDTKNTDILNDLPAAIRNSCIQRYKDILDDDILDIRIALGYFDWTTGKAVNYKGGNYGFSPSMDLGAFAALKSMLLSRCQGQASFCGFQQDTQDMNRFYKTVFIHGRPRSAVIQMHFSSATEFLNDNLGGFYEEQQKRTKFMENYFAQALQNADAVFYFGHSRNGGGPDFSPPVFVRGKNKVDYDGYYEVQTPGLVKMVSALSNYKKTSVLGLMSCASREHFLKRIRSTAPRTGVITSKDVLNIDHVFTAMIGAVDSILRGQCQRTFYESLRLTPKNKEYITMDNMFEGP